MWENRNAKRCWRAASVAGLCLAAMGVGCPGPGSILTGRDADPIEDAKPISLDGRPVALTTDLFSLGTLEKDQVLRLKVEGTAVEAVFLLTEDAVVDTAGAIVGGGAPNEAFDYRVQIAGRYSVFVLFDPEVDESQYEGTIAAEAGDAEYQPPARQVVQVVFEEGYLTEPGLFDPDSNTDEDKALLESLSDSVAVQIVERLRTIFDRTPIEIVAEGDELPAEPFSRLYYRPDRVLAEDQDVFDAAFPQPDPDKPECQVRVIFGEVLPRGTRYDPGNRRLDDEAAVYVGSFQGRGETCRTKVTDSVNNMVLALAQTGAHEIGHLVGLFHTEQVTLMHRSATLAFMRELTFERGQVQIEQHGDGDVIASVFTNIIQDTDVYFQAAFRQ